MDKNEVKIGERLKKEENTELLIKDEIDKDSEVLDGGFGWFIVFVGTLGAMLITTQGPCFGAVYGQRLEELGATPGMGAWLFNFQSLTWNLAGPWTGPLSEVFSLRQIGFFGATLISVSYFLSALVTDPRWLFFTFAVLVGVGGGLSMMCCFYTIPQYFNKRLGLANGIMVAGGSLGFMFLPQLLSFLQDIYPFKAAAFIAGAIFLNTPVLLLLLHPASWHKKKQTTPSRTTPSLQVTPSTTYELSQNLTNEKQNTNKTDLSTNKTDLSTNKTDLSTNKTDLSTNDFTTNLETNINTNKTDLSTNETDLSTNETDLSMETSDLSMENSDLSTKNSDLNTNTTVNKILLNVKNYDMPRGLSVPQDLMRLNGVEDNYLKIEDKYIMNGRRKRRLTESECEVGDYQLGVTYKGSGLLRRNIVIGGSTNMGSMYFLEKHNDDEINTSQDFDSMDVTKSKWKRIWKEFRAQYNLTLIKDPYAASLALSSSLTITSGINIFAATPFVLREGGYDLQDTATAMSVAAIIDLFSRLLSSPLTDIPCVDIRVLFAFGQIVFASTPFALLYGLSEWWTVLGCMALLGMGLGIILVLDCLMVIKILGAHRLSSVFGLSQFLRCIFFAILGPIGGQLRKSWGNYTATLTFYACVMLLGFTLLCCNIIYSKCCLRNTTSLTRSPSSESTSLE